jgi:hypothetical protein
MIEYRFDEQMSGLPRLFFIRESPETDTDAFFRFLRRQSDRP